MNYSGTYLADMRVQTNINSGLSEFVISVNESDNCVSYYNHGTTSANSTNGLIIVSTVLNLITGDRASIKNIGNTTVNVLPNQSSTQFVSPTSALRLILLTHL
ncbi:hypothetical protein ACQKIW_28325 [Bacillus thuringiensis]|uniref:hypothetical protein n=1 Tax=Bacillus thuringiensis TaxID=1428 RepID=UPI003CFC7C01